jgi:hypothetical protein
MNQTNMSTSCRVTLDTIDVSANDSLVATLLTDDGTRVLIPTELLPDGANIGDVLLLSITRDPDETAARVERVSTLQRKLFE